MSDVDKRFSVYESLRDLAKETLARFWGFLGLSLLMLFLGIIFQLIVTFIIFAIVDIPSLFTNEGVESISTSRRWGANLFALFISYLLSCLCLSVLGKAGVHVVEEDAVYPIESLATGIATTPRMAIVLAPLFVFHAALAGLSLTFSAPISWTTDLTTPEIMPQVYQMLTISGLFWLVGVTLLLVLCSLFAPILSVLHRETVWFGALKQCLQLTSGYRLKIFLLLLSIFSILLIAIIVFSGISFAIFSSYFVFSSLPFIALLFCLILIGFLIITTVIVAITSLLSAQIHERLQSLNSN